MKDKNKSCSYIVVPPRNGDVGIIGFRTYDEEFFSDVHKYIRMYEDARQYRDEVMDKGLKENIKKIRGEK